MNATGFALIVAVLLGIGLMLPLSHGVRWTLILLLVGLAVATVMGGGIEYFNSLFQ